MAYAVQFDTQATTMEVKLSTGGTMQASFGSVQYVNTGKSGLDGTTFYPTVSEDCTLSWTNDGGKENPAPVNIKGAKGDQGEPGKDGAFIPITNLELEELLK
jgi:hypothetical protein